MSDASRVAVLASGSGSNLQALLDRFADPRAAARIVQVVSDRPDAGALIRARQAGVPGLVVSGENEAKRDEDLAACLQDSAAELVVLAGYLRLVPARLVRAYRGRMINIHPSLLPAFGGRGMYGRRVHEAVLESGVRVSGASVHFVDAEFDRGRIVAQWPVPVHLTDTPESLARRVLEVEHRLLPEVVAAWATGRVSLDEGGRCRWVSPWFEKSAFLMSEEPEHVVRSPKRIR